MVNNENTAPAAAKKPAAKTAAKAAPKAAAKPAAKPATSKPVAKPAAKKAPAKPAAKTAAAVAVAAAPVAEYNFTKRYKMLTGVDDSSFCDKVVIHLENGYELFGAPSITFNGKDVIVGQAVVLKKLPKAAKKK